MFDARLACLWFCLPAEGGRSSSHMELAKSWTSEHDVRHLDDDVLQWSRRTALKIGDEEWFKGVETLKFQALQAIVPLGPLMQDDLRGYAFVTPFASALKSFQTCLASFVKEEPGERTGSAGPNFTTALHVDLRSFLTSTLGRSPETINGVEGLTPSGLHFDISSTKSGVSIDSDIKVFLGQFTKSVSVNIENTRARMFADCTMKLDDVGSTIPQIQRSLSSLFELTKLHIHQVRKSVSSQSAVY